MMHIDLAGTISYFDELPIPDLPLMGDCRKLWIDERLVEQIFTGKKWIHYSMFFKDDVPLDNPILDEIEGQIICYNNQWLTPSKWEGMEK